MQASRLDGNLATGFALGTHTTINFIVQVDQIIKAIEMSITSPVIIARSERNLNAD